MKTCSKCRIPKPDSQFDYTNKAQGKLHAYCRECQKNYSKRSYKKNKITHNKRCLKTRKLRVQSCREYVWEILKISRCACGENHPAALDFDHVDPKKKMAKVSDLIHKGTSIERLKIEIEKCVIMCANCHRKRTAIQFGWYKNLNAGYPEVAPA